MLTAAGQALLPPPPKPRIAIEPVAAWVKNDHIGFEILYMFQGVIKKYRPDFIIKLKTGNFLVLETKGQDSQKDRTKRAFLEEWVRAVNDKGGFGKWSWSVSYNPSDVPEILKAC